jgi:type VI secretion system protein ImpH
MSPDDLTLTDSPLASPSQTPTPAPAPASAHAQEAGAVALNLLRTQPYGFSLFAALRVLEQSFAQQPRLGESRKASDDAVRLGQAPHLSFAPSDVATATTQDDGPLRLEQHGFGVFGPNGALPLHLTELAYERRRHREDGTVVDFLNLFQHRLISLFYRAWANSEPAVSLDRPDTDRFRAYVGALFGLAPESAHNADAVPDYAKLYRAGRFAQQTRSADGLEAVLADYFDVPVEVRQFSGAWLDIPDDLHCRLGEQRLGVSTTLGASTWQCQHKFEIVLGPLPRAEFSDFLPGAPGLTELHSLVRLYTNDEWSWQVRLLLRDVDIPGTSLGPAGALRAGNRLGWTTWLSSRRAGAEDVVIQDTRVPAAPNSVTSGARHNG